MKRSKFAHECRDGRYGSELHRGVGHVMPRLSFRLEDQTEVATAPQFALEAEMVSEGTAELGREVGHTPLRPREPVG